MARTRKGRGKPRPLSPRGLRAKVAELSAELARVQTAWAYHDAEQRKREDAWRSHAQTLAATLRYLTHAPWWRRWFIASAEHAVLQYSRALDAAGTVKRGA